MITEKDIELIESYLAGKLSQAALAETERRLQSDQGFRMQVEIMRDLPVAIKSESAEFREDLKKVLEEGKTKTRKVRRLSMTNIILAVAAAVTLLLAVNFLLSEPSPDELYAAHFVVPQENLTVRNEQIHDTHLLEAVKAYSAGNFDLASQHFQSFLAANPEHQAARFFYGMSQMANEDYSHALQTLKILQDDPGIYDQSLQWYLGLLNLKLGKTSEALTYFEVLSSSENSYREESASILHALK